MPWCGSRFPRSKAAHQPPSLPRDAGAPGRGLRGTPRDVLTLFDEGGVIVASSEPELGTLLREFKWKTLFWQRRDEVIESMRFYVFGHSIYEKGLAALQGHHRQDRIFDVPPRELGAAAAAAARHAGCAPGKIFQRAEGACRDRGLCAAAGAGHSRLGRGQRRRALLR